MMWNRMIHFEYQGHTVCWRRSASSVKVSSSSTSVKRLIPNLFLVLLFVTRSRCLRLIHEIKLACKGYHTFFHQNATSTRDINITYPYVAPAHIEPATNRPTRSHTTGPTKPPSYSDWQSPGSSSIPVNQQIKDQESEQALHQNPWLALLHGPDLGSRFARRTLSSVYEH
ncbi:hypothetical protein J1614_005011 [Plenodomus biglobosus]|nr:hypothetical protein J1614_005011 [Plenodomus biglobosus]